MIVSREGQSRTSAARKSNLKPTDEQLAAIDAFASGRNTKIVAGAGTGKTATLRMISESTGKRGVYLAFNRAMADDAKKRMPGNVQVYTAHALAYRATNGAFAAKVGSRLPAMMAAQAAGISGLGQDISFRRDGEACVIRVSAAAIGYLLLDWVGSYCMSDKVILDEGCLPWGRAFRWLEVETGNATKEDFAAARGIAMQLKSAVIRLWERMSNPLDSFPSTHDVYLKAWALTRPRIPADFILFDEAQDANGVMLGLVGMQAAQRVYVGDPNQQIYSWRGAVNAMSLIATERETRLTESFRFSEHIARYANHALQRFCESDLRLIGRANPSAPIPSDVARRAIVCRTNSGVMEALAQHNADISKVYVAGGTAQMISLLRGMGELHETGRTQHRELCHFESWQTFCEHCGESKNDLAVLLKLAGGGPEIDTLIGMLNGTAREPRGDSIVISTAHKAKGLEWGTVELAGDFLHPEHRHWSREEGNLLYVAGTRAMRALAVDEDLAELLGCEEFYLPEVRRGRMQRRSNLAVVRGLDIGRYDGSRVRIARDKDNPYDHDAVGVFTPAGLLLGWLYRKDNNRPVVLVKLDGGQSMFGGIDGQTVVFYT